jgi:hypothetical protein
MAYAEDEIHWKSKLLWLAAGAQSEAAVPQDERLIGASKLPKSEE